MVQKMESNLLNNESNNCTYKIISTFTGAGGLDIGFHGDFNYLGKKFNKLKFDTKYALDINSDACKTLEKIIELAMTLSSHDGKLNIQ